MVTNYNVPLFTLYIVYIILYITGLIPGKFDILEGMTVILTNHNEVNSQIGPFFKTKTHRITFICPWLRWG